MDYVAALLAELADKPLDEQFDALKAFYKNNPSAVSDPRLQAYHLAHHDELADWAYRRNNQ